jgi:hypothetical protein
MFSFFIYLADPFIDEWLLSVLFLIWQGRIEKISTTVEGSTYSTTGVIEVVSETKMCITELPIRFWPWDHTDFLESLIRQDVRDKAVEFPIEVYGLPMHCR